MREPLHDMLTKLARTRRVRRVRRRPLHADRRHGQHHLQLHRNKILDEVALQLCGIAHDSRPALRMFVRRHSRLSAATPPLGHQRLLGLFPLRG